MTAARPGHGELGDESPPPGQGARADRSGPDAPFAAGFATGDPECCVCPVCRSIAALRDPSPELAERLATGAGDFAAGVASLLRALASVSTPTARRARRGDAAGPTPASTPTAGDMAEPTTARGPADTPTAGTPTGADMAGSAATGGTAGTRSDTSAAPAADAPGPWRDTVWREAARTRHDSWPAAEPDDVWAAATRAEAGTRETGTTAGPDRGTPAGPEQPRPAAPPATGRPPVPASRTPEGPVGTGPGEQAGPGEGG